MRQGEICRIVQAGRRTSFWSGLLPKFTLKVFGRFELSGPQGPVDLSSKKLAALLTCLVCSGPGPQSREKLASMLWGSHLDSQARQNLRQALSRIRRALGVDVVIGDGDVVALTPGMIDCDAVRLEQLAADGRGAALAEAVALYRDRLLADVSVAEEGWAEWLATERRRFESVALDLMVRHASEALRSGDGETALKTANQAIDTNSLREDAHRLVMQALAATGRRAEAFEHYRNLAALLKRELDTEPDAVTRALLSELRTAAPDVRAVEEQRDGKERTASALVPLPANGDGQNRMGRRQLTIMICNIAGTVPFPGSLDAEDFHELVAAFNQAVADAVARFGGFVAQYQGNGVVVYFGYPTADEHDAEQAVRASLSVMDAVRSLETPAATTLEASVGIATGPVVIGESPGSDGLRQRVAIGETPSLAARLQVTAAAGQIVISANTRRLVGRLFDSRALRAIEAPGLAGPVEAWLVTGEAPGVSRFEVRS